MNAGRQTRELTLLTPQYWLWGGALCSPPCLLPASLRCAVYPMTHTRLPSGPLPDPPPHRPPLPLATEDPRGVGGWGDDVGLDNWGTRRRLCATSLSLPMPAMTPGSLEKARPEPCFPHLVLQPSSGYSGHSFYGARAELGLWGYKDVGAQG